MELDKNFALVILVVAVMAIGAYLYVNAPLVSGETISVSGQSEITTMPDFVSVYILIETNNSSAQSAKDRNSEISEKVMDELRRLGFSNDEIQTVSWNVYEDYSWNQDGRKFEGYKVSHLIKVEMKDYKFVGNVVDRVIGAGALVQSINFEITKERENELKAQALEDATKEAKRKAEAIASGSGKRVGKIVSISAGESYYYPYPFYDYAVRASDVKEAVTQISPRQLSVNGNVQVVYQLR